MLIKKIKECKTVVLNNARIDLRYSQLIKSIYKDPTLLVKIGENLQTSKISIKKQVRQRETMSQKLYT